jgi:hypothetical protein
MKQANRALPNIIMYFNKLLKKFEKIEIFSISLMFLVVSYIYSALQPKNLYS